MAKVSYQMLGILSLSDRKRASPPSTEISVLTLAVKKSTKKISGVYILKNRRENLKLMSSSWSSWPRPQNENEEDVGPGKQNVRAASTKEKLKVGFFKPLNGLQALTLEM